MRSPQSQERPLHGLLLSKMFENNFIFTLNFKNNFEENNVAEKVFSLVAIMLILLINIPVLSKVFQKTNFIFIDKLITADCILCLSNCIILFSIVLGKTKNSSICLVFPPFGYFVNITKRLLSIGIIVWRYVFVLHNSWVQTQDQRRLFCLGLALTILFIAVFSTFFCIFYRDQYLFYLGLEFKHL